MPPSFLRFTVRFFGFWLVVFLRLRGIPSRDKRGGRRSAEF